MSLLDKIKKVGSSNNVVKPLPNLEVNSNLIPISSDVTSDLELEAISNQFGIGDNDFSRSMFLNPPMTSK